MPVFPIIGPSFRVGDRNYLNAGCEFPVYDGKRKVWQQKFSRAVEASRPTLRIFGDCCDRDINLIGKA